MFFAVILLDFCLNNVVFRLFIALKRLFCLIFRRFYRFFAVLSYASGSFCNQIITWVL